MDTRSLLAMPARRSNRWTQDDENPGSIFHELVVLPTLAPHLARPEYEEATSGPIILPQPRSQQLKNGVTVVGQLPLGACLRLISFLVAN